jgi:hypothetical protein
MVCRQDLSPGKIQVRQELNEVLKYCAHPQKECLPYETEYALIRLLAHHPFSP